MTLSVSDVQEVYGEQEPALDSTKQQALLDIAERMRSDVFGGRVSRMSEIEGDTDDFTRYLAAHLWEIAEGGQVGSESQTGGSVNFQHLQTNVESTLGETTYGRICLMMMRTKASIGVVRTDF